MEVKETPKELELKYEEKYGHMSKDELKQTVRSSIAHKWVDMERKQKEEQAQREAKYNLPYGEIIKAVNSARKRISDLEEKTQKLRGDKRAELSKQYEHLAKYGRAPMSDKEIWISIQLVNYMENSESDFYKVKADLATARKDLAIYLARKEQKEKDLADVIEAERYRTRRAELLSADPEALRALGIEPIISATSATPATKIEGSKAEELRAALKGVHPSASDSEIEGMLSSVI